MSRFALIFAVVLSAPIGFAQVIYEPVRSQFGDKEKFYYGGTDRNLIERQAALEDRCGYTMLNEPSPQLRVYSDAYPGHNAAIYGCSDVDARNEAYARVPRFFRKGDLIAAGERQIDGSIHVPAQANPISRIVIIPARRVIPATTQHPVIVIPKEFLDRKLFPESKLAA